MKKRKRTVVLLFSAVALIAIILLAAGLSTFSFSGDGNQKGLPWQLPPVPTSAPVDVGETSPPTGGHLSLGIDMIVFLLLGLTLFSIVYQLIRRQGLRLLGFLIGILFFLTFIYVMSNLPREAVPAQEAEQGGVAPQPTESVPPNPAKVPPWLVATASFTLALLLVGGGWFAWSRLRPRSHEASPLPELAQEAHEALEELRAGADIKDAVTRCYAKMSEILSRQQNIHRERGMTAHEFARHLESLRLPREDVWRLTRLFERVRYGDRPPGHVEEMEAISCLSAIEQAITGRQEIAQASEPL